MEQSLNTKAQLETITQDEADKFVGKKILRGTTGSALLGTASAFFISSASEEYRAPTIITVVECGVAAALLLSAAVKFGRVIKTIDDYNNNPSEIMQGYGKAIRN